MAACIIAMLFIGVGMVSTVTPKYLPLIRSTRRSASRSLCLVLIRLALRLYYGAPPLPADLPAPMKLGAKLSHLALYGLMIVMPLLGLACCGPRPIRCAVWRYPDSGAAAAERQPAHAALECSLLSRFRFFALVLLHIAAGLFHALIRRDGVFETIAPLPLTERVTPAE
jgi:cytochrome b561